MYCNIRTENANPQMIPNVLSLNDGLSLPHCSQDLHLTNRKKHFSDIFRYLTSSCFKAVCISNKVNFSSLFLNRRLSCGVTTYFFSSSEPW